MTAYDVPRTRWASELRTLLQGDLTSVTLSISTDQAGCYSTLKKAILTRLGITQSARFSAWLDPNPRSSETVSQVYHRTLDVTLTCLRDCNCIEDCATLITQEVVYHQVQPSVAQFVRAQKPPTAQDMVQAADTWVAEGKFDRLTAWKSHTTWKGPRPQRPSDRLPYRPRPQQRDHPSPPPSQPLSEDSKPPTYPEHHIPSPTSIKREKSDQPNHRPNDLSKYFDDVKGPLCFNSRKWGHISAACPDRDLYRIRHTQPSQPTVTRLPSLFTVGTIGEVPVRFFLDSGADLTVINKQTLDELRYAGMTTPSQQSDVTIKGVHGPETSLPVVHLDCKIMGRIFTLPMAISNDIRHDVILVRDCDILYALMKTAIKDIPQDVLVVQTRQQGAAESHCQQQNADASEELFALQTSLGTTLTSHTQTYPCQTQTLILHLTWILTPFRNPVLILRPSAGTNVMTPHWQNLGLPQIRRTPRISPNMASFIDNLPIDWENLFGRSFSLPTGANRYWI